MKQLLSILLFFFSSYTYSQYYYVDIIGTKQTNQQYKLIQNNELRQINATSYDANNEVSKDFVLEQTINNKNQQIITRSATIGSVESFFTSIYQAGRVSQTRDSGNNAINTVDYQYDGGGKLISTKAVSKDFDGTFTTTEVHVWNYNEKNLPVKMLKIKNGTDTTVVAFKYDEQDNVSEESWIKGSRTIETYFYYYNPKKQLTDIVRYNRRAKQMLPDYIFEYDNGGHIILMTQTQRSSANYLVYKYTYNDRGLKEKELLYNKQKEFLGKIEYTYK